MNRIFGLGYEYGEAPCGLIHIYSNRVPRLRAK
jgi:hypothetical protein